MTDSGKSFSWDGQGKKYLLCVLSAGLVIRIIYAWLAVSVAPWNDMAVYDSARLTILNHGKYIYGGSWPPGYPLLLAAITFVFGDGYLPLYLTQAVISSLTCLLIYLIAKKTFNGTAGFIALLISSFYVDMIWYSGILLAETFGIFLLCAVVYLLLLKKSPAIPGVLFGLTCLVKGVYLISFPALLLWIFLISDRKKAVSAAAKFAAFTFLAISPWTVWNSFEHGKFVLLTPHEGGSVFMGHNPSATGGADFDFMDKDFAGFYNDNSLSEAQKSQMAFNFGVDYALHHPAREVQLFFLKLSKYWSLRTHFDPNNGPYPLKRTFFYLSIAIHSLLFPACFLGAVFSLKNKSAAISAFAICINTLVFTTLYFASGRMRFQLVPFIIILASYGFSLTPEIISRFRKSGMADISGKVTAAATLTLLLYANFIMQAVEKHKDIARRF